MFVKRFITLAATAVICALMLTASAGAQTNSKEILALPADKLVELLKNPNATVFEKGKACQRLAVIGTKDAVPALAALLADEHLNVYARTSLENIPDPSAAAALRDATKTLQGRQLIGVLDSLGQRKDVAATPLLKNMLKSKNPAIVAAAAGSLGRIGTAEAAPALLAALAKKSPAKIPLADACMACAEGLAAAGNTAEALKLYQAVEKAKVPKFLKIAALYGQFHIKKADGLNLLLAQVRSADPEFFELGLRVARQIPGEKATAALAAEVQKLPAARQALLIRALGDRSDTAAVLPVLRAGVESDSADVSAAALQVLAKIGDASAGDILLVAALGNRPVAQTAKESLKGIPGIAVDAAIVAKFAGADAKAKQTLLDLVGARRIGAAGAAAQQALSDNDEAVRIAALAAMAQLVELKNLDLLTSRALGKASEAEVKAAKTALTMAAQRMIDRDGCAAKLGECLKGAAPDNQVYLLDLLGKVSGPKALAVVVETVKTGNPALKDNASRVLGEWVNADAAPALLEIVKTDCDKKYQVRALRGYIRIARQLQLPDDAKLAMYKTAMDLAQRKEEKQLAVGVLSRIPSVATLEIAVSHLGNPELKDAGTDAAVKIAVKLLAAQPKAVAEAMQKVVDAKVGGPNGDRAKQLLGQAKSAIK